MSPSNPRGGKRVGHDGVPWAATDSPARILMMRFQAFGDVVAVLPAVRGLRHRLPESRIDFLTRDDMCELPAAIDLFDNVYTIGGRRRHLLQRLSALHIGPRLARNRYDVVIDLQNNDVSNGLRRRVAGSVWSAFDRYSPEPHAERARRAIESALSIDVPLAFDLRLKESAGGLGLIPAEYRDSDLVVLNPAGFFPSRNWPLENYVEFAKAWRARHRNAAFVVVGDARVAAKAAALRVALPGQLLDLVGKTTVTQAFEVLQRAALVVSEDSGLLHMAWCGGRPSIALFGSTRSDWARPLGPHSVLLDSSDLPCGQCMSPTCRYGDTRCLTRYTPEEVAARAEALLASLP